MSDTDIKMDEATNSTAPLTDDEFCQEENADTNLDLELIKCVKEQVHLYTKTDKRYNDRNFTERSWAKIAVQLGLPKEETKKRWRAVRNNYIKAMGRRTTRRSNGAPHIKPWIFENDMAFIRDHITQIKNPAANVSGSATFDQQSYEPQSQECASASDSEYMVFSGGGAGIAQPKTKMPKCDVTDEAMVKYIRSLEREKDEPLVGWFKTLLPSLKILSPTRLANFQISVMQEMVKLTAEEELHQSQISSASHTTHHILQVQVQDSEDNIPS